MAKHDAAEKHPFTIVIVGGGIAGLAAVCNLSFAVQISQILD